MASTASHGGNLKRPPATERRGTQAPSAHEVNLRTTSRNPGSDELSPHHNDSSVCLCEKNRAVFEWLVNNIDDIRGVVHSKKPGAHPRQAGTSGAAAKKKQKTTKAKTGSQTKPQAKPRQASKKTKATHPKPAPIRQTGGSPARPSESSHDAAEAPSMPVLPPEARVALESFKKDEHDLIIRMKSVHTDGNDAWDNLPEPLQAVLADLFCKYSIAQHPLCVCCVQAVVCVVLACPPVLTPITPAAYAHTALVCPDWREDETHRFFEGTGSWPLTKWAKEVMGHSKLGAVEAHRKRLVINTTSLWTAKGDDWVEGGTGTPYPLAKWDVALKAVWLCFQFDGTWFSHSLDRPRDKIAFDCYSLIAATARRLYSGNDALQDVEGDEAALADSQGRRVPLLGLEDALRMYYPAVKDDDVITGFIPDSRDFKEYDGFRNDMSQ